MNIVRGTTLSLELTPSADDLPDLAPLGRVTATATPCPTTVGVALTLVLAPTLTDAPDSGLAGAVRWVSRLAGVAAPAGGSGRTGIRVGHMCVPALFPDAAGPRAASVTGP